MKAIKAILFVGISCLTMLGQSARSQQTSDLLTGTYLLSGDGMYESFVFDGAGKVKLVPFAETEYDYFQIKDTIIVYPDKDIFVFLKKDNRTIEGISTWVKGSVYKRMNNDTVPPCNRPVSEKYISQYYRFYQLLGNGAPSLTTFFDLIENKALYAEMETLCNEGFSKACLTLANAEMSNSNSLILFLTGESPDTKALPEDSKVVAYYHKAINLKDLNAYAQLGAYYTLLNQKEKAKKVFEIGCKLGNVNCCLASAGLNLEEEE